MSCHWCKYLRNIRLWLIAVAVVAVCGVVVGIALKLRSNKAITVTIDTSIGITPTQIRRIEAIGKWEFLTISDEVMVDTVRQDFFSKAELIRIYRGTLRFGIDLAKAKDDWIITVGDDSLSVTLPPIELLDKNFIDEASTTSFYEKGSWSAGEREELYQKAAREMTERNMTPHNIAEAEHNGEAQMRQLLSAMGFRHVSIRFKK